MRNFSEKQVKRSIRNFESVAHDVIDARYQSYKVKIHKFLEIIQKDIVINSIIGFLFEKKVDFDSIHIAKNEYWIDELKLPTDVCGQLTYVLQMFRMITEEEMSLVYISYSIYRQKSFEENIILWLNDVVRPCFKELLYRLNDLIEDEVAGKEKVAPVALQIFN